MNYLKEVSTQNWRSLIAYAVGVVLLVATIVFASWLFDQPWSARTTAIAGALWACSVAGIFCLVMFWAIDREVDEWMKREFGNS